MGVKVVMNPAALIEIANIANDKLAEPAAKKVAARAGGAPDYEVRTTDRVSESNAGSWARTRVWTNTPAAMAREIRQGTLQRALGSG